ncbi:hypothetical protein [Clostridium massiliamazoniense]|uniref:hypothetical protein n=1 Tax=Clostridium massiliamazoniense TaxID=1347366 RepID=UPI0011C7C76D|nr:hypothetical protein [Clostridium massiliamazoniense]
MLVIFIGAFIFLVGWYSVAIIGSLFISKNIDLVFKHIILRFITQYFIIAFHSSIILLITIKT